MKNNLGLYVSDATIDFNISGYDTIDGKQWSRKALFKNGQEIAKTAFELNSLGLYYVNKSIKLNGATVARTEESPEGRILPENGDLFFGDVQLSSVNTCINITPENYALLKQGKHVEGYAKYNPHSVYYITDNPETESIHYHDDLTDNENIIFNNFESHEGERVGLIVDNDGHQVTNATFVDPRNTPEFVVRKFTAILEPNEKLAFEYFVDSKNYDYSERGSLTDTFTTYVTDEWGHELFRRTTYGGQFKVVANVEFKDENNNLLQPGTETWFKIHCVDQEGRGSVQYFFNVLIKPSEGLGLYPVQSEDLDDYDIVEGELVGTEAQKYEQGIKNKKGFHQLCWWAKSQGYSGIRIADEDSTFIFDSRSNAGTIEYDPVTGDRIEHFVPAYNDYFIVNVTKCDFTKDKDGNITAVDVIVKALDANNTILIDSSKRNDKSIYANEVTVNNKVTYVKKTVDELLQTYPTLAASQIVKNKEILGITVTTDDPYDWVRADGSRLHRDATGKIQVMWRGASSTEVYIANAEAKEYDEETGEEIPQGDNTVVNTNYLRVGSLDNLLYLIGNYSDIKKSKLANWFHKGTGYYYVALHHGTFKHNAESMAIEQLGLGDYPLPDDFTIDLNGATIKQTTDDIHRSWNHIFYMNGRRNIHIKNGKIVGSYTRDTIKDAYLKQCHRKGSPWEGAEIISASGSRYCSFDNVTFENLTGYGVFLGWLDQRQQYYSALSRRYIYFGYELNSSNIVKYPDIYGGEVTLNTQDKPSPKIQYDGQSVVTMDMLGYYLANTTIPSNIYPYISVEDIQNKLADVCLITSGVTNNVVSIGGEDRYGSVLNSDIHFNYTCKYNPNDNTTGLENVPNIQRDYVESFMVIHSASKWIQSGCFKEVFVVFYNDRDEVVDIIKTIPNTGFHAPKESTYCRLVMYGIGRKVGKNFIPYTSKVWSAKTSQFINEHVAATYNMKIHKEVGTYSFFLTDCVINNTRSIFSGNCGINHVVSNCTFKKVACTDYSFSLTPMLYDLEESSAFYYNNVFEHCTIDRSSQVEASYKKEQSVLGCLTMINLVIENCNGIGIGGGPINCYFANTKFSRFSVSYSGGVYQNYKCIIHDCTVRREDVKFVYTELTGSQIDNPLKDKYCWERVSKSSNLENNYFIRYPYMEDSATPLYKHKTVKVVGRCNKFGNIILGDEGQLNTFKELLNVQLASFHDEDIPYKSKALEYSWVHMLVETDETNVLTNIVRWHSPNTYVTNPFMRRTYNGKNANAIYIDGTRYLSGQDNCQLFTRQSDNWFNLNLPSKYKPGYHIISFWLSTYISGGDNNQLLIPKEALCVLLPEYAGDTSIVLHPEYANTDNAVLLPTLFAKEPMSIGAYASVFLIFKGKQPIRLWLRGDDADIRGYVVETLVLNGAKQNFINSTNMGIDWAAMSENITETNIDELLL